MSFLSEGADFLPGDKTDGAAGATGRMTAAEFDKIPLALLELRDALQTRGFYHASDYAVPVSTTYAGAVDCSTQLQAAIDAASAAGGGWVLLPPGYYGIGTTVVVKSGVRLQGLGRARTGTAHVVAATGPVLKPLAVDTDVLRVVEGGNNVSIDCVSFRHGDVEFWSGTRTHTGAGIKLSTLLDSRPAWDQENEGTQITNCDFAGIGIGIFGPWIEGAELAEPPPEASTLIAQYGYMHVERIRFMKCGMGLLLAGMSDSYFRDIHCDRLDGLDASDYQPSIGPIVDGGGHSDTWGHASSQGSGRTCSNLIQDLGNAVLDKFAIYDCGGDGLVLHDSVAVHLTNTIISDADGHGLVLAGVGSGSKITNSRFALNGGSGIHVATTVNYSRGIVFSNNLIEGNAEHGVSATVGSGEIISSLDFLGNSVRDNSTSSTGTYNGYNLPNVSDVAIIGGHSGNHAVAATQGFAFAGTGTANRWRVVGLDTTGSASTDSTIAGRYLDLFGVQGLTNRGGDVFTPTVNAGTGSGNLKTNTGPWEVRVYQTGGQGLRIVQQDTDTVTIPGDPTFFVLRKGEACWWNTAVPSSWKWIGV